MHKQIYATLYIPSETWMRLSRSRYYTSIADMSAAITRWDHGFASEANDKIEMKTSLPLVAAVLALFLMAATVQSIRLDAESHSAFSKQTVNNTSGDNVVAVVVAKTDGEPSGEMEKAISEEKSRVGHELPDIHIIFIDT
uniref:Uncharacterized protein n=1 Tax=Oryza meridionalis TaxID=40149 RepID=A0A0E0DXW6_9ORYZ